MNFRVNHAQRRFSIEIKVADRAMHPPYPQLPCEKDVQSAFGDLNVVVVEYSRGTTVVVFDCLADSVEQDDLESSIGRLADVWPNHTFTAARLLGLCFNR